MFVVVDVVDAVRVPAHNLRLPTLKALQSEIDIKYPNRVLMDVGLVISRYGGILKITNGSCVPGDGGAHHECLFRLVVFRPFVEEVCVGTIVKSTREGVQVSLGFFQNIFIPAYWMLRPSQYDEKVGLWVWTPDYGEDEEEDENDNAEVTSGHATIKENTAAVKTEEDLTSTSKIKEENDDSAADDDDEEAEEETGDRWEMEIGAEIRFKVKSIQFTQVTNTAKGVQATTTTTDHSHSIPTSEQEELALEKPQRLRKRSTSVDISESQNIPGAMQIIASICEDGLGLTSWWTSADDGGDESNDGEEEGEEGQ